MVWDVYSLLHYMAQRPRQPLYNGWEILGHLEAASLMALRAPVTAEQLAQLPGDNTRWDLVRGEVWNMPLAKRTHGRIALRLARLLGDHVDQHRLGEVAGAETGFMLGRKPDTVLGPDVAFVQTGRIPPDDESDDSWTLAPDLAVEIYAPGEGAGKMAIKVKAYLDAGVRLVWVVYPGPHRVAEHTSGAPPRTLGDDDRLDGAGVVPGFTCPVRSLWA